LTRLDYVLFHQGLSELYSPKEANYQSLRAATRYCAEGLGLNKLGWLVPGMVADVVAFAPSNNPLDDIFASQNVSFVVKDGKMYDTSTLSQIVPNSLSLPMGPRLESKVVGCEDDTRVGATFMGACTSPRSLPVPPGDSGEALSDGEKAGIAIGVIVGVGILGAAAYFGLKGQRGLSVNSGVAEPMLKSSV
jgi:hypothetical protein